MRTGSLRQLAAILKACRSRCGMQIAGGEVGYNFPGKIVGVYKLGYLPSLAGSDERARQRAGRMTPLLVKTCQRPFSYLISSMRPTLGTSWPSTASITPGFFSRMATPS